MQCMIRILLLAATVKLSLLPAYADETQAEDFSFLAGMWRGEGFGGHSEEMWMPPSNGRVFGIFTQVNDSELVFSEFMEITETTDGWILRLKHFNPDFSGWEEKADYVTFKLQSVSENKAVFGGLSYEVTGDKLVVSLRLQEDDGSITTEYFNFQRVEV